MHIGRSVDELLRVQRALIDTYQTKKVAPANWCPGDDFMQSAADSVSGGTKGWLQRVMRPIDKS
jgi:alkyl hydroperoxide reductase subunit AhpC